MNKLNDKLSNEALPDCTNPVLPAGRLTNYQKRILFELAMGGKIFAFQFPDEYGFDDVDVNSYSFRKDTFYTLMNMGLIEVAERPSLTCQTYGLTKKAESLLAACR
jgi:hypothetical protein